MNLPNQTKSIERKTYNANAVTTGVNASFSFTNLLKHAAIGALKGGIGSL